MDNRSIFLAALNECCDAEDTLQAALNTVLNRVAESRETAEKRIRELETKCYDLPSEELRRLTAQVETTEKQTITDFWMNYYQGGSARRLSDLELSRTKTRIKTLEAEIRTTPATPEEIELAGLRRKVAGPTREERGQLTELLNQLGAARSRVKSCAADLTADIAEGRKALDILERETVASERFHIRERGCDDLVERVWQLIGGAA